MNIKYDDLGRASCCQGDLGQHGGQTLEKGMQLMILLCSILELCVYFCCGHLALSVNSLHGPSGEEWKNKSE